MGIFISYSSRDSAILGNLLSAMRQAHEDVWFDNELSGGEAWWREILEQIRASDVFIFALSNNSLKSKACLAELQYARDLHKPIVPVQIGPVSSMRVTPVADVEAIEFQNPTVDAGIRLTVAVREARQRMAPLPSPLPDEPPVPFAYLMRLANSLNGPQLDPRTQTTLLAELRSSLQEDGDDANARRDIIQLLCALRDRPDVTFRTRGEVEYLLASLGVGPGMSAPAGGPAGPVTSPSIPITSPNIPVAAPPGGGYGQAPGAQGQQLYAPGVPQGAGMPPAGPHGKTGTKRNLIIGAAVGVVALIGLIVAVSQPEKSEPAKRENLPSLTADQLPLTLLSVSDVDRIIGSRMEATDVVNESDLRARPQTASEPACLVTVADDPETMYSDSGFSTFNAQWFHEEGHAAELDVTQLFAGQVALAFSSSDFAEASFQKLAKAWQSCEGKLVTLTTATDEMRESKWAVDNFRETKGSIAIALVEQAATGWTCQRAAAVYSNFIFDARACSDTASPDAATRMVDEMVSKAKGLS